MKRAKREEVSNSSIDRISELPLEILQRILYFLSQRDAVRTSVLSKSWSNIWCSRPNLDFSVHTFNGNKQEFLFTVDNTLQRYRDQKLSLEEFHLCISIGYWDHESVSLLEKWIPALTTMGMKKSRLSIRPEYCWRHGHLPAVVFGAQSLKDLYVERFELDQDAIKRILPFNRLRVLRLLQVSIEDGIFAKIIACCPLIETLHVIKCTNLRTIEVNDLHNLKDFAYEGLFIPSISLATTTSTSCRSNIRLRYRPSEDTCSSWFLKLSELLKSLSQSIISLSICHYHMNYEDIVPENILVHNNGCDKPVVVESLNISYMRDSSYFSCVLSALFCICRPRNIGNIDYMSWNMDITKCLWKILTKREESGDRDDRFRQLWLQDLEQVSLEIKDGNGEKEWRLTCMSELRRKYYLTCFRFALKWRRTL